MTEAIPDCIVSGFESLIDGLSLPDANDRHVLAAAIKANAQVIVTANLTDFPADKLAPFSIEAKHPDEFVLDLIDLAPAKAALVVSEQAASLRNPPRTVHDVLDTLQEQGLVQSVAKLRELLGPGETD
jgi:hypothetical protein